MVTNNIEQKKKKSQCARKLVIKHVIGMSPILCSFLLFICFGLLSVCLYKYFPSDLFFSYSKECLGDNITYFIVNNFNFIKNDDINLIGIPIMIGLLSVIAVAGLSYFTFSSNLYPLGNRLRKGKRESKQSKKRRERIRTGIINLLCVIIFFIFIFLFLGFFESKVINLFVFISSSGLLFLAACFLGEIFERHSIKEALDLDKKKRKRNGK